MKLLLISSRKAYATKRLVIEAAALDIQITVMEVGELAKTNYEVNRSNYDALYIRQVYLEFDRPAPLPHLQKIIQLAQQFQQAGRVVVDSAIAAGDLGAGKYKALTTLEAEHILVPQTSTLDNISISDLVFPVIAKWNYGFGSKHTYLVNNLDELKQVQHNYHSGEIIIQEFIKADYEYKVITVGYKSLPVVIKVKTNHSKFLPNLADYQVLSAEAIPSVIQLAKTAAKILHRELAKTDILEVNGKFYVLEVNRWPGLQYFEKVSKYNVARAFLEYIGQICKKSRFPL